LDLYDVDAVEAAEASIDQFISKRAREKADADRVEAAWVESARRHRARRRERNRQEWLGFYEHMNRLHLGLAAEHADRRSRLLAECEYETDEAPDPDDVGEGGLLE
jgi:hypothetical protein